MDYSSLLWLLVGASVCLTSGCAPAHQTMERQAPTAAPPRAAESGQPDAKAGPEPGGQRDEGTATGKEPSGLAPPASPLPPPPATPAAAKEQWGIEVALLTLSAGGYMLDFRYKVLDPAKAAPLLTREAKRYLIHPKSGAKLLVPSSPKVGPLRQTTREPLPGHVYFTIFANPGRLVKPGDDVTVVLGDCRIEGLVVK